MKNKGAKPMTNEQMIAQLEKELAQYKSLLRVQYDETYYTTTEQGEQWSYGDTVLSLAEQGLLKLLNDIDGTIQNIAALCGDTEESIKPVLENLIKKGLVEVLD
jgi:murein L,D-transpeptidase YafK